MCLRGSWATREEAEQAQQAALEARDELWEPGVTLAAYGERWLDKLESTGKRDIRTDRSRWKVLLCEHAAFSDDPVHAVTRADIRDWVRQLMQTPIRRCNGGSKVVNGNRRLSRQTVGKALGMLRRCLDEAVEDGYLASNPAKDMRVPRGAEERASNDAWTHLSLDEIERILKAPGVPLKARTAYSVCIYSGLRQGELCGLQWADIDLDSATPHIVVRRSWGKAPKNGRVRRVPMLPVLCGWLRRWRLEEPAEPGQHVFRNADGGLHGRGYDFGWDDVRDWKCSGTTWLGHRWQAGITRKVRFHDLRHTCASHLVMGSWGRRWRLEEIRELLGHTDIKTTQRYSHLAPDALHAAARETEHWTRTGRFDENVNGSDARHRPSKPTVRGSNPLGRANDSGHLRELRDFTPSSSRPVEMARAIARRVADGTQVADSSLVEFARVVLTEQPLSDAVKLASGDLDDHSLHRASRLALWVIDGNSAPGQRKEKVHG